MDYNSKALRNLLMDGFSGDEFKVFCFDYFLPVYQQFETGMGRTLKIQLLIEHCDRHGLIPDLLALIKNESPYRYETYLADLFSPLILQSKLSPQKSQVDIILVGEFSTISDTIKIAVVGAIAGILDISRDQIDLISAELGSLKILLVMPNNESQNLILMKALEMLTASENADRLNSRKALERLISIDYSKHDIEAIRNLNMKDITMELFQYNATNVDKEVLYSFIGQQDGLTWVYFENETQVEMVRLEYALSATDRFPNWELARIFGDFSELRCSKQENGKFELNYFTEDTQFKDKTGLDWNLPIVWYRRGVPSQTLLHGTFDVKSSQELGRGSWSEARIPRWLHYPVDVDVTQPDQEALRVVLITQDYYAEDQSVPLTRLLRLETRMLEVEAI